MAGRRTRAVRPLPIWHRVLRLERPNQFEDKSSNDFPPCGGDVGIGEKENKAKNVQKIHLPGRGFEAQQKKMQRIMGPCACTGALWDYVIVLPAPTRVRRFYALKSGSKHK